MREGGRAIEGGGGEGTERERANERSNGIETSIERWSGVREEDEGREREVLPLDPCPFSSSGCKASAAAGLTLPRLRQHQLQLSLQRSSGSWPHRRLHLSLEARPKSEE